jgi:ATP-dependent Clp protease ATP-binding subunit ClpA
MNNLDPNEENYIKKNYDIKGALSDDEDDVDDSFRQKKNQGNSSKTPILDSYSRDLTKLAEEDKLDPIVGRMKEIERVSQILARRKKNNPILIGEPGCVDGDTLITIRKISDEMGHEICDF